MVFVFLREIVGRSVAIHLNPLPQANVVPAEPRPHDWLPDTEHAFGQIRKVRLVFEPPILNSRRFRSCLWFKGGLQENRRQHRKYPEWFLQACPAVPALKDPLLD